MMVRKIRSFFEPIINADAAEQVAAIGALFGGFDNTLADETVKNLALEVGESFLVVTVGSHFC